MTTRTTGESNDPIGRAPACGRLACALGAGASHYATIAPGGWAAALRLTAG